MNRRHFLTLSTTAAAAALLPIDQIAFAASLKETGYIMTVRGKLKPGKAGVFLPHEHAFTDFTGAEKVVQPQYTSGKGFDFLLPHLKKLKASGVGTMAECTPAYIGRDVALLQRLSEATGLNIITNTGYYAAVDFKYIPAHAYTETADQLAARWIREWQYGIEGTGIRPGFIKLGVGNAALKPLEKKLILAAAKTHLQTGLKIAIHTGNGEAAAEELEFLEAAGVAPGAMIWVHAQNDRDGNHRLELGRKGCWISLDGFNAQPDTVVHYLKALRELKEAGLWKQVLISHDDGFSVLKKENDVGFEPFGNAGRQLYAAVFDTLRPAMLSGGFTSADFSQLTVVNPAKAFCIGVHAR